MQAVHFFRSRIDVMINLNDPLAVLASRLPWSQIESAVATKFEHQNRIGEILKAQDMFGTPRNWWVPVALMPDVPSSPFA